MAGLPRSSGRSDTRPGIRFALNRSSPEVRGSLATKRVDIRKAVDALFFCPRITGNRDPRANRDEKLLRLFDQTRDTEVEHANLLQAPGRQLEQLRKSKSYHGCDDCGYTTGIDLPMCALCRSQEHQHTVE